MIGALASAPCGEIDREQILAHIVDELTWALHLVEEAGLGELITQLQIISDEAQRELDSCRSAALLS